MFAAVIALVFAFGISVVSGSNAYALQGSHLMASHMKYTTMAKKTSKNKKTSKSKSKKALNKMGAGCL
ncbi:MAG: hypothetical protein EVG15_08245 [Candidatus Acididesulfobacter diazotrophicus]|jgi:hypothetical protein|uniref:Uncharacterized protein n=1 Tax=Candidatus Acididesulfobacter diazotrophicus TaxID=2597226 RepID=A0A519BL82_9DELT|nr:MAG: hypothetical protein EVG15_08245 [Candidatus Acididesulfobacter diazotrophicus]